MKITPLLAASVQINDAQILDQNWMYRSDAHHYTVRNFSDCDTTVLQDHSPHVLNDIVIPARPGSTWTKFTVYWCAAIFEAVVPLLYACGAHGIVSESPLNLADGFHLSIAKLSAK